MELRPRQQPQQYFDGKIGIWPIGRFVPAVRSSRNRPRGTPVWKNEQLRRDNYREMMIDLVLPAIKERYPCHTKEQILIQHDNAPGHTKNDDPAVLAKIAELNIPVEYMFQPPNSPDLNICDLSFFRSLQTHQLKQEATHNNVQLMESVARAYNDYDPDKLRDSFLTLQGCMNNILLEHGGNEYKIPHMGKRRLERMGELPTTLRAPETVMNYWLLNNNDGHLNNNNHDDESSDDNESAGSDDESEFDIYENYIIDDDESSDDESGDEESSDESSDDE